jgi:hypothetical protein
MVQARNPTLALPFHGKQPRSQRSWLAQDANPGRCDVPSKEGLIRSVTKVIGRIADSFADIENDAPHECEFCGARTRSGRRFCDEHEDEFVTRH